MSIIRYTQKNLSTTYDYKPETSITARYFNQKQPEKSKDHI